MSELWQSFLESRARVTSKWAHYFPIYDRHFARFKDTACTVLEIGVAGGGSLQMWKRYFGPLASIVGIDIEPKCATLEEAQIRVRIGDQSNASFLRSVIEEAGTPDVVIDDGSHVQAHVRASFEALYPLVDRRGVYLIEDLHAAYQAEFGLRGESFIERSKTLIDELNSRGGFATSTDSIHFYNSVVVFEKSPNPLPLQVTSGSFGEWRGI